MLSYTTSYSTKKKPHYRRNNTDFLPGGRRRQQRKPGARCLNHSQGFGRRGGRGGRGMNTNNSRKPYAFIAVGCAFLFFVASVIWYANREVPIMLNGVEAKARINSSIEQLIADQELNPSPGNLLAVDDSVLEKEGGERVSVKLNGKRVSASKLADTKLQPDDKVEVANGRDRYEEHDVQATEIAPTLTVEGRGAIKYVKTWGVPGRSEVWVGKQSGITADKGVVQEVVNCEVVCRSVSPDKKGKKYVALTFDEGPSENTQQIVKILQEKGAGATFFLSGDAVKKRSDAVKAIAQAGFDIGSNSYSDVDLSGLSGDDLRNQLTRGFDAISKAADVSTALLRPPYGAFSEQDWVQAMDLVSVVVTWNIDSGDWTLPGAQAVADTVVGSVSNGNIVLLTDNSSTSAQTVEALPLIIDRLQAEGYELLSLSDLIKTDEDLSKDLKSLTKVTMPKDAVLPQLAADGADQE